MPKPLKTLVLLHALLFAVSYSQAQFSQPGELDTTFNFGVPHSFFSDLNNPVTGEGAAGGLVTCALQPDGKVLIGGSFTAYNGSPRNNIARLNTNGSLDATFNPGSGANGGVRSLAVQPDGKIIIVGDFTFYNSTARNRIARLNADGSLDATFNPGTGVGGGFNPGVFSLTLQPDGKVLIGGDFTSYNGIARNRIARLNANGSLDATFNPGIGANDPVLSLTLQLDGKVLIVGHFSTYNGMGYNRIARLNANGTLDATFNPGIGANSSVYSIALQPDGKILMGGVFTTYNGIGCNRIARLNSDGSLDTTFNPSNGVGGGSLPTVYSLGLQPDGKLLIVGEFSTYNGTPRNFIARVNADGSLDATFNPGTGANNSVKTVAIQPDGKILIGGGFFTYNGTIRSGIARLNANGSLDATFNPGSGANNQVYTISLQPDGKILAGGNFTSYSGIIRIRIARLNADGSIDSTFNPGIGANNGILTLALQPDGKVLIGGFFTNYNGTPRNYIARLNADGSLDATFNPGTGASSTVQTITLQPDGKIIIGGFFSNYNGTPRNRIARLNADGSLDATFNPGTGADGAVRSLSFQPDGKVLIGGDFLAHNGTPRNRIARLNSNGSLDTNFNPGTGANNVVNSLFLQPDGKVIIGGQFTNYNGTARNYIARLNANGTLDVTFNPGTGFGGSNPIIRSTTLQPDGKILIGGQFTTYNGVSRNRIARVNAYGGLDTTFNPGTGASGGSSPDVYTLALQTNGKVLIGGGFTNFNGIYRARNARVFAPNCVTSVTNTTSSSAICQGATKSLSGTAGGSWTIVSGPGSILGTTYTASGSGIVSLYNDVGGCTSPLVTFTVNPLPSAPIVPALAAICTGNNTTITPVVGGANYRFYANSTGGSPLAGGDGVTSYTTPNLTATTTYHVASVSAEGCESTTRTAATVTVNPLPSAPTAPAPAAICAGNTATITPTAGGANYRFYAASSGGSPLVGGNGVASYTTPSLSNTTTYHVASVSAFGCEGNTRTAVTVIVNPLPSAPATPPPAAICASNTATITPTAGGASYRFYAASIGGSPLPGGNGVASYTTPTLSTTTTYHVASVSTFGCESNTRTAVTVTVNPLPTAPTAPAPAAICAGNTATITPTAGGANYRFYDNSLGGSPLPGGNGVASFTTPSLSTTTTYHVSSVSAQGCESNTRTAVTITIDLPQAPTASAPAPICAGNTVSITPTAGGANYNFYSTPSGGSPLANGNGVASFTTPTLSNTTTFHVASVSTLGCVSSNRTAVTVFVNPLPPLPTLSAINQCGPGIITINPTGGGGGTLYNFYSVPSGGVPLNINPSLSYLTYVSNSTIYYVSSISSFGCVSSARTPVQVTILPRPSVTLIQAGDTLKAISSETNFQWFYNGSLLPGATGSFIIPNLPGDFYVQVTNSSGCTDVSNTIALVLSISEINVISAVNVEVYPSPFQRNIFLKSNEFFNYELLDLRGLTIMAGETATTEAHLFTDHLASGIYFVKIMGKNGTVIRKVMKE